MKSLRLRIASLAAIGGLFVALFLSSCATITNAVNTMTNDINNGVSAAASSPKLNFYVVYGITGVFTAFGAKGAAYKPGQGTVWEATNKSGGTSSTSTIERALLKNNADGTQWWRLSVSSSDGSKFLYEYLIERDSTIDKVRYRDPNTGKVEQFIPDTSQETQQGQTAPSPSQTSSGSSSGSGDQVTVTKDRQTITVKAGTFNTEHVTYVDKTKDYRDEVWSSDKVPGGLVKYADTNTQSNELSTGQLVKIESGIGTVLGSY